MFYPGQHVICVLEWSAKFWRGIEFSVPRRGTVYTVRGIYELGDEVGLFLQEITNPVILTTAGRREPSFTSKSFRPLDDSRLSIFREALRTTDKPVETVS